MSLELDALKDIPGYKAILKSVLKSQIQLLIEQLSDHTGEESIILTASVNDGSLSHLGSCTGKGFLEGRDEIKSQFLGYCLKTHHKKKTQETRSPYQRSNIGAPRSSPQHSQPKRPRPNPAPAQTHSPIQQPAGLDHSAQGYSGHDPSGDTGQILRQGQVVKQETSGDPTSRDNNFSLSDTVSFPDAIKRRHTQTSSDPANSDSDQRQGGGDDESNDSTNIKIEPINEADELEITGVEPGAVPEGSGDDSWAQGGGDISYSSAGEQMTPGADGTDYRFLGPQYNRHQGIKRQNPSQFPAPHTLIQQQSNLPFPETQNLQQSNLPTPNLNSSLPLPDSLNLQPHICPFCGKAAGSRNDLVRHIRKHTGEKPYKCELCNRAFTRNETLTQHKMTKHDSDTNDPTESDSDSDESLAKATTSAKKPKPFYYCKTCDFKSHYMSNLSRHKKSHSSIGKDVKPLNLVCDVCGATFITKYGMKRHVDSKHKLKFRYKCEICNKGFIVLSTYRGHVASHDKMLREKCSKCDATFQYKSSLRDHMIAQHEGGASFPCKECDKTFASPKGLKEHSNVVHGKQRFKCSKCPRTFNWRSSRAKHEKTSHLLDF